MKIRYSRFRTFLLAFTFAMAVISIYGRLAGYFDEIPVDLPQVESDTPFIIKVCPEFGTEAYRKEVTCHGGGGGG